jgi:hypothetical protein
MANAILSEVRGIIDATAYSVTNEGQWQVANNLTNAYGAKSIFRSTSICSSLIEEREGPQCLTISEMINSRGQECLTCSIHHILPKGSTGDPEYIPVGFLNWVPDEVWAASAPKPLAPGQKPEPVVRLLASGRISRESPILEDYGSDRLQLVLRDGNLCLEAFTAEG